MDKKNNIIKDELEYFQSIIDKKKKETKYLLLFQQYFY